MANNRMVLVCNVCKPKDWDYIDKKGILPIAKWYPGGAYYRNDTASMGEEFEKFMEEHSHIELASEHYLKGAGQPNPVRLEYESIDMPVLPTSNPEEYI